MLKPRTAEDPERAGEFGPVARTAVVVDAAPARVAGRPEPVQARTARPPVERHGAYAVWPRMLDV
ncbi:hypothetical protein [Streptomyces sp. NPDC006134]|uniref:hypothetical protein n=1 Tax=Streptomyces sp. NPDC006134 TaxID=3154467 RepID=UPI0033D819A6